MPRIAIIIPAYNEQNRIKKTLESYATYFNAKTAYTVSLLVVLNGCTDNTAEVVQSLQKEYPNIMMITLTQAGKGLAIKAGFLDAVKHNYDLIGFVDADMATQPCHFEDSICNMGEHDGIIASRYMPGAQIYPPRPFVKEWGRRLFYNSLIRLLFGLRYKDLQCGAKLFKHNVVAVVAPALTMEQWAFDVELLYLCKINRFQIKEYPTVWYDQAESKLRVMRSGLRMLSSVIHLRLAYLFKKRIEQ